MSDEQPRKPQGGDAIRLKKPWKWGMVGTQLKIGDIGILSAGLRPYEPTDRVSIIFNPYGGGAFMDSRYCSVSGGPGTVCTLVSELHPTEETITLNFWNWANNIPGPGRGVNYRQTVPIWDWIPVESEKV